MDGRCGNHFSPHSLAALAIAGSEFCAISLASMQARRSILVDLLDSLTKSFSTLHIKSICACKPFISSFMSAPFKVNGVVRSPFSSEIGAGANQPKRQRISYVNPCGGVFVHASTVQFFYL